MAHGGALLCRYPMFPEGRGLPYKIVATIEQQAALVLLADFPLSILKTLGIMDSVSSGGVPALF